MNIKDLLACLSPKTKALIAHELGNFDDTDPPYDPYHEWVDLVMKEDEVEAQQFFGHLDLLNKGNLTIRPTVDPSDMRLSLEDYHMSHHVQIALLKFGDDFYFSMVAALMLLSDTFNAERLRTCWPRIWADYVARKESPHGVLPEEGC